MSGPKVVNIQAVRRRQQRESTARLRELTAILKECSGLHGTDLADATKFRQQTATVLANLETLRTGGQWAQLLYQTTGYCQLYRDEANTLRRNAAAHRAAVLNREHHRRQGSAKLSAELEKLPASPARDEALRKLAAAGNDETAWMTVADEITRDLAESRQTSMQTQFTNRLRELATAYLDPNAKPDAARLPGAPPDPDELRLERCWTALAELELDGTVHDLANWKQRIQTAADTADPNHRGLLLDSLALEISSLIQERRLIAEKTAALQSILAELKSLDAPTAETWRAQIRAALDHPAPVAEMHSLANAAHAWITQEQSHEDAREQRAAVLRGLASLGYEVRENMTAAWMQQGRIVIHKPGDGQYGIEFSAPASGDAFQARVVAADTGSRSQQRDREVEEGWCAEFARLRASLAEAGFATNMVRTHAPGEVPVKTVASGERSAASRDLSRPASRQLRDRDS